MSYRQHRRWILAAILTGALLTGKITSAQKIVSPEGLLQSAIQKESVDGDLKTAIEIYKKVAQSKDRAIAAKALIHMADCYQKLGDAQARTIFEQVVREFADQKEEVALARTRLGSIPATASAKGDRAVWTGPNVDRFGTISPDGRFMTYVDWINGSLMLHDFGANKERVLTPPAPDYSQYPWGSAISSDGKQVLYKWLDDQNRTGLRIASLQGSGFVEPRQIYLENNDVPCCLQSFAWSPDLKWVAAAIDRRDGRPQITLISVANGSFRVLKSTGNVPETIFFSLDSKYVAYSLPAADGIDHDVFVLAIDGSRESLAVVPGARAVMGWSPDGTRLLFSSDRTGSVGLWAVPFADGKVQGAPELLKSDIGSSVSLGLTASGALYVYKTTSTRDVKIAPIDLGEGKLLGTPLSLTQGFIEGARNPSWSPDGKYLAYPVPCNYGCIALRSVETGQVRRLASTLTDAKLPSWSPDGRSLLAKGTDRSGRFGIFQIDVQTGEATAVILSDGLTVATQWSSDGKKVYFGRNGVFVGRDLASGVERDVYRVEPGVYPGGNLSPDGQYFSLTRGDRSTRTASVLLVPSAGGPFRELIRLAPGEVMGPGTVWTPDSSAVIIQRDRNTTPHERDSDQSRWELWLVPVKGGQPRKLDIDPYIWREGAKTEGSVVLSGDGGFSLSPDGRRIAMMIGKSVSEVWALENFLPAHKSNK